MGGAPLRFFVVYEDGPSDMGQVECVLRHNHCAWDEYCRRRGGGSFDPLAHRGIIILGGGNYSWRRETGWVEEARQASRFVLGICQGAQALAVAAGGSCEPGLPGEVLIDHGITPLSLTREGRADPIIGRLSGGQPMYQWHRWVYRVPTPPAIDLVRSVNEDCPHSDAFSLDDGRSYGLHFHPELSSTTIAEWTEGAVDRTGCLEIARFGWEILDAWVKRATQG
jgi:GMP synthase-like glutamine amidotransferase